ncbi:hypothetical protein [Hymenobacter jejuensis]|uniref:Uncharacterized protein n=1 Tax=Hymenobacter jejuensis TaxID=2502781 RepID=A0A5B8A513_9BACT|nr:hypothetical protein [Hymenobacter jejuensis]QDA62361.1 hypothetical protein FHG12_20685 [Hymenobacter jejuensis]
MQAFRKRNARTATLANLVINAVIPFFILLPVSAINVKGGAPNLLTLLLPAVFISALATTIATFATLPGRPSGLGWLPAAVLNGVGIGLLFAVPVLVALLVMQFLISDNHLISKPIALLMSAITGAGVGYLASFVALRRALKLHNSSLNDAASASL